MSELGHEVLSIELAPYFYCLTFRRVSGAARPPLPLRLPCRLSGLSFSNAIHVGGLPWRLPWPNVSRSSATIASSILVRSSCNSASIFRRSISANVTLTSRRSISASQGLGPTTVYEPAKYALRHTLPDLKCANLCYYLHRFSTKPPVRTRRRVVECSKPIVGGARIQQSLLRLLISTPITESLATPGEVSKHLECQQALVVLPITREYRNINKYE